MKIYGFPISPRTFKVLAAARHLGVAYTLEVVDLPKREQFQPRILALNPDHRLPILEDDGYVLWESNVILHYLAAKAPTAGLLPVDDVKAQLAVVRWLYWDAAQWDVACAVLVFEHFIKAFIGAGDPDPKEVERGTELFNRCAAVLEGELAKHRFIAGDQLTIADFALGSSLLLAEAARYPLQAYPHVRRWHAELSALPAWQQTLAEAQPAMSAA